MPILTYHFVRKASETGLKVFDEIAFLNQLEIIKRKYGFIDPWEIVRPEERRVLGKRVLLTFDDGYKEHSRFVLEALETYNVKGIFFINTKPLTEGKFLRINLIHLLLANLGYEEHKVDRLIESLELSLKPRDVKEYRMKYYRVGRFDSASVQYLKSLLQWIVEDDFVDEFLDSALGELPKIDDFYMNSDDIHGVSNYGHMIANHTANHLHLDKISKDTVRSEIMSAHRILNGIAPNYCDKVFAYPHGRFSDETIETLSTLGWEYAFTVSPGHQGTWNDYTLNTSRISCNLFDQD